MWRLGRKAEIQQLSEEQEPGYLAHSYLPSKIKYVGACVVRGQDVF